ncbi:hypothetical protein PF008_g27587 [Phytophthora fragariae]|uniref:Uncharacterized protein n=1 Tax=Phytophthora fragariae TaxID=53985 RepID=A0A6G0QDX5_9STRA|nr:hypothetical protein PF008_g27587 [Phytophthora fragariae]
MNNSKMHLRWLTTTCRTGSPKEARWALTIKPSTPVVAVAEHDELDAVVALVAAVGPIKEEAVVQAKLARR